MRGFHDSFRQPFLRKAFRGFLGLTIATPVIAVVQGGYLLSDFRKYHHDAPFPEMPCAGVVVVRPKTVDSAASSSSSAAASWFSSFPLLREQKDPDPLRLLVVGDSLAAGVGTTKQGTPVLPEAIAKSLSRALGGRAVHWTCMGEPGLSSPQIVKDLLLAQEEVEANVGDVDDDDAERIDVMEELKDWWREKRQQQLEDQKQPSMDGSEQPTSKSPARVREWWRRTRDTVRQDVKHLKEEIHWQDLGSSVRDRLKKIPEKIPHPPAVMQRHGRNTLVPDLVAEYDVAIVVTGFNDLKNLIFPVQPPDPNTIKKKMPDKKFLIEDEAEVSRGWFERDLYRIMDALKSKMRNYESKQETEKDSAHNTGHGDTDNSIGVIPQKSDQGSSNSLRHHPMVVFPANPLFAEKVYPLMWFATPMLKFMENQKKKLAEAYPAPVLFLDSPDPKTISDYVNRRGPLWEGTKKEDVLLKITNKAQSGRENVEKLMKEYYDMWTTDVEEVEPTYTYDAFGPDIEGPLVHLHHGRLLDRKTAKPRSPLVSPDKVHPSDEGYELWGRHIANAIVKEWNRSDEEAT